MTKKLLAASLLLLLTTACAKKVTTTLPAGATGTTDASTYRVLADAHAFLQSIHDSVTSGMLALTPTQTATYNDLVTASNTADALWEVCHAGGCSAAQQTQLTQDTNDLNGKLAAAQSQIVTGQ